MNNKGETDGRWRWLPANQTVRWKQTCQAIAYNLANRIEFTFEVFRIVPSDSRRSLKDHTADGDGNFDADDQRSKRERDA